MKENPIRSLSGIPMLLVLIALVLAGGYLFAGNAQAGNIGGIVAGIALVLVAGFCLLGLYSVQPNQSAVLSLF
jgi:type IV secretory pathway VirB2 component (pilin)